MISIIIGIFVMAIVMYVLFAPSPISLPPILLGVGSIVSVIVLIIALTSKSS